MIARRRALLVAVLAAVRIREWQSVRQLVMTRCDEQSLWHPPALRGLGACFDS